MNFKIWLEQNYKGHHKAPNRNNGAPLYDLTKVFPSDVYENIMQYASDFSQKKATQIILRYRNKPDKLIRIYRAVPKNVDVINPGDWVAITREYATQHSKHPTDPTQDLIIISAEVFAKDLYTDGNSFEEWGYNGKFSLKSN